MVEDHGTERRRRLACYLYQSSQVPCTKKHDPRASSAEDLLQDGGACRTRQKTEGRVAVQGADIPHGGPHARTTHFDLHELSLNNARGEPGGASLGP